MTSIEDRNAIECPFCKAHPIFVTEEVTEDNKMHNEHQLRCSHPSGFKTCFYLTKAEAEKHWNDMMLECISNRVLLGR
jgi:hypothetical protein